MNIFDALIEEMKKYGTRKISRKTGISENTMYNWTIGRATPSLPTAEIVANAMGMDLCLKERTEGREMPKMGVKKVVISMTRSDEWTTPVPQTRDDKIKAFCYDHCPHPDEPCKGNCPELREYTEKTKKRRAERV